MRKSELIALVAADFPGLKTREIELAVSTVFAEIAAALARGQGVSLNGFGNFRTKRLRARASTNPKTGDPVEAPAKALPAFKAARALLAVVNGE